MSNKGKIISAAALFVVMGISLVIGPAIEVWKLEIPKSGNIPQTGFMRYRNFAPVSEWTELDRISPALVCSVVKGEDRNFFLHRGFDWGQIFKAATRLFSTKQMGGSTISQQLARNLFLTPERSWWRKSREMIYTIWLEARFTKREILALYLNTIEWGHQVWGVRSAAKVYFGQEPDKILLAQALVMTSLVASPRKHIDEQAVRVGKVFRRVAHQLYYSEYISQTAFDTLQTAFSDFRESRTMASLQDIRPVFIPSVDSAIEDQCGLRNELENTALAKQGHILSMNQRFRIKAALLAQNPNIAGISPDGDRVLLKSMNENDFTLMVEDLSTGATVVRDDSRFTQTSPTWRFDSQALAYSMATDKSQRYQICVLPMGGTRSCSKDLWSDSAPLVRWAPDGKSIAFLRSTRGTFGDELVIAAGAPPYRPMAVQGTLFSDRAAFDWSADSKNLAAIPLQARGSLAFFDIAGQHLETVPIVTGECRSIHWGEVQHEVLVTCRAEGAEFYELFRLDRRTKKVSKIASEKGDILWPARLPDKKSVVYHVNEDSENKLRILRQSKPARFGPQKGHNVVAGASRDGRNLFVLHVGRTSPARLLKVDLATGKTAVIRETPSDPSLRPIDSVRIDLTAADKTSIPAYLWRPETPHGMGRATILVHGGPNGQSSRFWNPVTQAMASAGVTVLSLNYRGSTGYGARFETKLGSHRARMQDLRAAIDYIVDKFKIPQEHIVVLGHSYGSQLALDTLAGPEYSKVRVVARNLPPIRTQRQWSGDNRLTVFTGEWDPAFAKIPVVELLQGHDYRGIQLSEEGHNFDRVASQALVFGTTLEQLLQ